MVQELRNRYAVSRLAHKVKIRSRSLSRLFTLCGLAPKSANAVNFVHFGWASHFSFIFSFSGLTQFHMDRRIKEKSKRKGNV